MATAREHMAADIAAVLADTGEAAATVDIDGTDVDVIRQPVGMEEYPPAAPGILVQYDRFWVLREDLGYLPEVGMELVIDNDPWLVEAVADWAVVLQLTLKRYLS